MISTPAVVCGLLAGGGVALVVSELLPSRPDLAAVAARIDATAPRSADPAGDGLQERVGEQLLASLGRVVSVPREDLAVLGISPAQHVGGKALWSLYGLLVPQIFTAVLALAGGGSALVLPVLLSFGLAAAFWFNADADVRSKAAAARGEFRHAVASFLERAALERAADAGAAEALHRAADVGDSWVCLRIRTALAHSQLSGVSPWQALRDLATEVDVPELARPADTLALAGEEGAAAYDTLKAQADALRSAQLTDAQTTANEASTKMVFPVTARVLLLLVLVGYPAISRIMSA